MANNDKDSDYERVQAAQNGDQEAFAALVAKYQDRIFNTLLRMIGDYDTALDLSQETFLRAYQNITGFQQKSSFFTWLFRIALNLATSKRRQYARRPRSVSLHPHQEGRQNNFYEPQADIPAPYHELVQQETQSLVQKGISTLPEDFREVLVLRDIEGLSYEEIQEILGCPIGTVRSRLHRARSILKDKLQDMM